VRIRFGCGFDSRIYGSWFYYKNLSWCTVTWTATSVTNRRTIRGWASGRGSDFSSYQEVHTGCEGHSASCSIRSRFLSGGRAVAAWSLPSTSVYCLGKEWVDLYLFFPLHAFLTRTVTALLRFEENNKIFFQSNAPYVLNQMYRLHVSD